MNDNPYRAPRAFESANPNILYKDLANAWITGVCAGIADRFNLSVGMVRLSCIIGMIFLPPITFLIYVLASFFLPMKPIAKEKTGYYLRDSLVVLDEQLTKQNERVSQLESYITSQDFDIRTKIHL